MDILPQLYDAKRQSTRFTEENLLSLAIEEIEQLRDIKVLYETLYNPLPQELISLIKAKRKAMQNDPIGFYKTDREIKQYLEKLQ